MTKYLVAQDGSGGSAIALKFCIEKVLKSGDAVHLVHVWNVPDASIYDLGVGEELAMPVLFAHQREEDERAEMVLAEQSSQLLCQTKDHILSEMKGMVTVTVSSVLSVNDDAGGVLLEEASQNGVDVIAVGSRGHGAVKRLILGSVSTWLVHNATCSVLVVRC
jgi:nucleotide-binding universal stress UspA family protein